MRRVVIFTGPSLSHEEAHAIFSEAIYLPPIKRGDISKAVDEGATIIGIIDGVFHQHVAVSPREILTILKICVVVGGGSMGALRAAELHDFGMIGVGKIFEMYRRGEIDSDDEVALIFNPITLEPLSEPLVNIRATFNKILEKNLIKREIIDNLLEIAKQLYYPDRTYETILEIAINKKILDEITAKRIYRIIEANKVNQKKLDAIDVVNKIKEIYYFSKIK